MNDWASPWASTINAPTTSPKGDKALPPSTWHHEDSLSTFDTDAQWGDLQENAGWGAEDSTPGAVGDSGVENHIQLAEERRNIVITASEDGAHAEHYRQTETNYAGESGGPSTTTTSTWLNKDVREGDVGNIWDNFEDGFENDISDVPRSNPLASIHLLNDSPIHGTAEPVTEGSGLDFLDWQNADTEPGFEPVDGDGESTEDTPKQEQDTSTDIHDAHDMGLGLIDLALLDRPLAPNEERGPKQTQYGETWDIFDDFADLNTGAVLDPGLPARETYFEPTALAGGDVDSLVGSMTISKDDKQERVHTSNSLTQVQGNRTEDVESPAIEKISSLELQEPANFSSQIDAPKTEEIKAPLRLHEFLDPFMNEGPETTSSSVFSPSHGDRTSSETARTSIVDLSTTIKSLILDVVPPEALVTAVGENDEFGDFGEFEEFVSKPEIPSVEVRDELDTPVQPSVPTVETVLPSSENLVEEEGGSSTIMAEKFITEFLRKDDDPALTTEGDISTEISTAVTAPESASEAVPELTVDTKDALPARTSAAEAIFIVNNAAIRDLFPSASGVHEIPGDMDDEILSSISSRKMWHRISRLGTLRAYDSGDVSDYVRISWPRSAIEDKVLKIVSRWAAEDRMNGGTPSFGANNNPFGPSFGWTDSPDLQAGPFRRIQPILPPTPSHRRKSSVAAAPAPTSGASNMFSWSSVPVLDVQASSVESPVTPQGLGIFVSEAQATQATPISPLVPPPASYATAVVSTQMQNLWIGMDELDVGQPVMQALTPVALPTNASSAMESSVATQFLALEASAASQSLSADGMNDELKSYGVSAVSHEAIEVSDSWDDFEAFESAPPVLRASGPAASSASTSAVSLSSVMPGHDMLNSATESNTFIDIVDNARVVEKQASANLGQADSADEIQDDWGDFEAFASEPPVLQALDPNTPIVTRPPVEAPQPAPMLDLFTPPMMTQGSPPSTESSRSSALTPAQKSQQPQDPWGDLSAFESSSMAPRISKAATNLPLTVSRHSELEQSWRTDMPVAVTHEMTDAERRIVDELVQALPDLSYMLR